MKAFLLVTNLEDFSRLKEDNLITLLQYCFKTMELISWDVKEVIELSKLTTLPYLNFVNLMYTKFSTSAIMRVGAERGDLWDVLADD